MAVKPGFARNFLIPKKKAVYATEINKGKHVIEHSEEERALMERKRDWLAFKERAAVRPIVFTRKVELDNQTLETPLTKADLAAAVRKQLKRRVEETEIRLPRGSVIKTVGDVVIRLELVLPQLLQAGEGAAAAGAAASGKTVATVAAAATAPCPDDGPQEQGGLPSSSEVMGSGRSTSSSARRASHNTTPPQATAALQRSPSPRVRARAAG